MYHFLLLLYVHDITWTSAGFLYLVGCHSSTSMMPSSAAILWHHSIPADSTTVLTVDSLTGRNFTVFPNRLSSTGHSGTQSFIISFISARSYPK